MKPTQYALLVSLLSVGYLLPNGEPERALKPLALEQASAQKHVDNSADHESFELMRQESSPRPITQLSRAGAPGGIRSHEHKTERIRNQRSEMQQPLRPNNSKAVVKEAVYLVPQFGPQGESSDR